MIGDSFDSDARKGVDRDQLGCQSAILYRFAEKQSAISRAYLDEMSRPEVAHKRVGDLGIGRSKVVIAEGIGAFPLNAVESRGLVAKPLDNLQYRHWIAALKLFQNRENGAVEMPFVLELPKPNHLG